MKTYIYLTIGSLSLGALLLVKFAMDTSEAMRSAYLIVIILEGTLAILLIISGLINLIHIILLRGENLCIIFDLEYNKNNIGLYSYFSSYIPERLSRMLEIMDRLSTHPVKLRVVRMHLKRFIYSNLIRNKQNELQLRGFTHGLNTTIILGSYEIHGKMLYLDIEILTAYKEKLINRAGLSAELDIYLADEIDNFLKQIVDEILNFHAPVKYN